MQASGIENNLGVRPQTSAVGQRQISEVFKLELLTDFKNNADLLQRNLTSVKQLDAATA